MYIKSPTIETYKKDFVFCMIILCVGISSHGSLKTHGRRKGQMGLHWSLSKVSVAGLFSHM